MLNVLRNRVPTKISHGGYCSKAFLEPTPKSMMERICKRLVNDFSQKHSTVIVRLGSKYPLL